MSQLAQRCAAALARPGGTQVVEWEGHWHDWDDLRRVAEQLRAQLAASQAPADAPVTFIPRNRPWAIAALLALLAEGRTIRMLYPFQSGEALAREIARLAAPLVIAEKDEFAPQVRAQLIQSGFCGIACDHSGAQPVAGAEEMRSDCRFDPAACDQIEILTSGTTGPPKQFPLPFSLIEGLLAGGTPGNQGAGNQPAADPAALPPAMLYMPIGNISGIYTTLPTLLRGQRAVLFDRFNLPQWRDFVARYRPALTGLPPAGVQMVLDAGIPREELAEVKAVGTGAAPLDPGVQAAFEEHYGIPILISYGATEFGGPVTATSLADIETYGTAKRGSAGRALPGVKLRIVDSASGAELPPDEEGLLEVVSPRVGPGWIRTSDLALLDEDGFLYPRGRADGAIMRGGFKVLPEVIERALHSHPAISAAGVVGVPDRRLGEVPGAVVQIRPGMAAPSEAELIQHLKALLLKTHIPVHWRFVEELPWTLSAKVHRPSLVRLFADEAGDP